MKEKNYRRNTTIQNDQSLKIWRKTTDGDVLYRRLMAGIPIKEVPVLFLSRVPGTKTGERLPSGSYYPMVVYISVNKVSCFKSENEIVVFNSGMIIFTPYENTGISTLLKWW